MARNRSDTPETLVAVDAVVAQSGFPGEWVWRQLADDEVKRDWDNSYAVRWTTAKRIADTARAAREESDRRNREEQERQAHEILELQEAANRRAVARAGEPRTLRGVEVSLPGDGPEPEWAEGD
jgi:hypothetical protein